MRALLLIGVFSTFLCACSSERYTESAPEIETFKLLNAGYTSGDFSGFDQIYADSAKMYFNSTSPLPWRQAVAGLKESLEMFSEYTYEEGQEFEFVTTDAGEQWLGWWGVFNGTLEENGKTIRIPMHISARFVNGKIVEETSYWDNQIVTDALAEDAL
jgi:ketosteroid isomerase-like protein